MSDAALRELERRWRTSGAVEDEAAWHAARSRAGQLDRGRLQLAADLGWRAAELAVGTLDPASPPGIVERLLPRRRPEPHTWTGLRAMFAGAAGQSEVQDRLLLAEGERVLDLVLAEIDQPGPEVPEEYRAWVGREVRAFHAQLRADLDELTARLLHSERPPRRGAPRDACWFNLRENGRQGARYSPAPDWSQWARALRDRIAARTHGRPHEGTPWPADGRAAARELGEPWASTWPAQIRAHLRPALAPWLLGLSDPLRAAADRLLERIEIATPCLAEWEDMQGDDQVRRCAACRHDVFDLSTLDRDEALALLRAREGQRLCVRLYRRPDGRVLTRDCAAAVQHAVESSRPVLGMVRYPEPGTVPLGEEDEP